MKYDKVLKKLIGTQLDWNFNNYFFTPAGKQLSKFSLSWRPVSQLLHDIVPHYLSSCLLYLADISLRSCLRLSSWRQPWAASHCVTVGEQALATARLWLCNCLPANVTLAPALGHSAWSSESSYFIHPTLTLICNVSFSNSGPPSF
jgi:hypothetical protein